MGRYARQLAAAARQFESETAVKRICAKHLTAPLEVASE